MPNDGSDDINDGSDDIVDYESLVEAFNQALLQKLRGHSVADTFLDFWVPEADSVLGIAGMVDSARIAGHQQIAIRFRCATVPELRIAELKTAVGRFAKVSLENQGDSVVLRATGMTQTAGGGEIESSRGKRSAQTHWQADRAPAASAVRTPSRNWDTTELPEYADVHPHFRAGLKAAMESLSHEGAPGDVGSGLTRVHGRDGAVTLALDVGPDTHLVRRAYHVGATTPSERAALDLFCRVAESLPLQEVADHAGLKVLDLLVDEDKPPPVGGILLPANAGAPFAQASRLARQACENYRTLMALDPETNFYYAPPSDSWQALTSTERRQQVIGGIRAFLQSEGLYPDDIELLNVQRNKYKYEIRAIVGFSESIEVDAKPPLMRRLERRLRRDLGAEIELIADRAKDTSPLRRLS